MNNQSFDYQQYEKMPLSMRKMMLSMVERLAPKDGSAAYMLVYEHDPDPELREIARQKLEQSGVHVGETDRPTEGSPGETHYQVDDPADDGTKTIALDGGDGQIKTPDQLTAVADLFVLDRSERGFLSGKSTHLSRRQIYISGAFVIIWGAVLIFLVTKLPTGNSSMGFFLALMALGEVLGIFFFIQAFRRERLFETRGKLLQGQIVSARGRLVTHHDTSNGHNTTTQSFEVTVSYVFRTPDGEKMTSSITQTRNDLEHADMPKAGAPIAVMYVDAKTFMLM